MGVKNEMPRDLKTYSFDTLAQRLIPASGGLPEANIDVLYDTQTYLAAGVAQLKFFVNVNADSTLANLELAGQLPANTYFDIYRVFCDAQRLPTATVANTAAGLINDLANIVHIARGSMAFKMKAKTLPGNGGIPLTFVGRSGGIEAAIGSGRADAAGAIVQWATMPDNGGWPVNGTIRLGPSTKFGINLDFAGGVAVSADTPLKITLLGVSYRPVS